MRKTTNYQERSELKSVINSYIGKVKTPTRLDNDALLKRFCEIKKSTDVADIKEAKTIRDNLVLSNGGFAMKQVMRYRAILGKDASILDLYQEAMLGLIETVDDFDISRNVAFTTYAFYHVRKRIVDFIKTNKLIRVPRDLAKNIRKIELVRDKLFSENREYPSAELISTELKNSYSVNLPVDKVELVLVVLDLNAADSSDTFLVELKDQHELCVEDEDDFDLLTKMKVNLVSQLSSHKYGDILSYRFGIEHDHPLSVEEIEYILDTDIDIEMSV